MIPALAAHASPPPRQRAGWASSRAEQHDGRWTPQGDAAADDADLQPLASFRDQIVMVTGLSSTRATRCPVKAPAINARTRLLPDRRIRRRPSADIRAGVSMDQIATAAQVKPRSWKAGASSNRASRSVPATRQLRTNTLSCAARRRRCRWKTIRGSSSSACSARAKPPIRGLAARRGWDQHSTPSTKPAGAQSIARSREARSSPQAIRDLERRSRGNDRAGCRR